MKNTKNIVEIYKDDLPLSNYIKNGEHGIEVPSEILDAILKSFQNRKSFIQEVQSASKAAESLWEVILTPKFQDGVDNGSLRMKKGSLEIRNAKTGKFVGKAELKEVSKVNINKTNQASLVSNISRSICNLSGQMQLAEISKKLDLLEEKIDLIGAFLWREKISELYAIKSIIDKALNSNLNSRALDRINESISKLTYLSEFFERSIESILNRKIKYNLGVDFFEGLKIWELTKQKKTEYNKQYIKKTKEFISEYGFLIDIYLQTLSLIGTCYQIMDEYDNAKEYYKKINDQIDFLSLELVNKLIYIFNVKGISLDEQATIYDIKKSLEKRNLPILDSVEESINIIESAQYMYESLNNQFKNVKVKYHIEPKKILEVKNNA